MEKELEGERNHFLPSTFVWPLSQVGGGERSENKDGFKHIFQIDFYAFFSLFNVYHYEKPKCLFFKSISMPDSTLSFLPLSASNHISFSATGKQY